LITKLRLKLIKTYNEFPPIPIRDHDWVAWFDGEEESRRYGWGETESEAVDDLLDSYGE